VVAAAPQYGQQAAQKLRARFDRRRVSAGPSLHVSRGEPRQAYQKPLSAGFFQSGGRGWNSRPSAWEKPFFAAVSADYRQQDTDSAACVESFMAGWGHGSGHACRPRPRRVRSRGPQEPIQMTRREYERVRRNPRRSRSWMSTRSRALKTSWNAISGTAVVEKHADVAGSGRAFQSASIATAAIPTAMPTVELLPPQSTREAQPTPRMSGRRGCDLFVRPNVRVGRPVSRCWTSRRASSRRGPPGGRRPVPARPPRQVQGARSRREDSPQAAVLLVLEQLVAARSLLQGHAVCDQEGGVEVTGLDVFHHRGHVPLSGLL
jgi:hypothetical protein